MGKNSKINVGVGLRPPHYPYLEENSPQSIQWFEAISENYMDSLGRPREMLFHIRRDFPVACHGVSMNIANTAGISEDYLNKLKRLVDALEPVIVSDHLCWTGSSAHGNLHDLLPLPYTSEAIEVVAENIQRVQDFLGHQFTLENVSTYLSFKHSEMKEWEFISEIQKKTGCGILLDVNNVFVNSVNHKFNPKLYIDGIDLSHVTQIHLAGHTNMKTHLFDTHIGPVNDEVWSLFKYTCNKISHAPFTLIEWDDEIPNFGVLELEAQKAQKIMGDFF